MYSVFVCWTRVAGSQTKLISINVTSVLFNVTETFLVKSSGD